MNDASKNPEDSPVKNLLKNLPEIKASPDFEEKLSRRINTLGKWGHLGTRLLRRPLPVFAYSLIAVAAVGMISYYIFIRSGIQPADLKQDKLQYSPAQPANSATRKEEEKGAVVEEGKKVSREAPSSLSLGKEERSDKGKLRMGDKDIPPAPFGAPKTTAGGEYRSAVSAAAPQAQLKSLRDSLAVIDSLRLDSLQRAQKQLKMKEQKAGQRKHAE